MDENGASGRRTIVGRRDTGGGFNNRRRRGTGRFLSRVQRDPSRQFHAQWHHDKRNRSPMSRKRVPSRDDGHPKLFRHRSARHHFRPDCPGVGGLACTEEERRVGPDSSLDHTPIGRRRLPTSGVGHNCWSHRHQDKAPAPGCRLRDRALFVGMWDRRFRRTPPTPIAI